MSPHAAAAAARRVWSADSHAKHADKSDVTAAADDDRSSCSECVRRRRREETSFTKFIYAASAS